MALQWMYNIVNVVCLCGVTRVGPIKSYFWSFLLFKMKTSMATLLLINSFQVFHDKVIKWLCRESEWFFDMLWMVSY